MSLTAGIVDLVVEYELLTGPGADSPDGQGKIDGPRVDIPIGSLGPDHNSGSMLLTFALPQDDDAVNNPAALWLATDCPVPASTALAESIQMTVSYTDCTSDSLGHQIADGPLRAVAEDLQGGYRIDGDLTTPGDSCLIDTVCLLVEYELSGYVGSETVDLPMWFAAVQCRHTTPENPFDGSKTGPCPTPTADPCPCCRTLGKLDFEGTQPGLGDSYADPGTYAFTDGDADYGLEIYDTADKDSERETVGVAFRLVALDGGTAPALCTVAVKGGRGFEQYDRVDGLSVDTTDLPGSDADGIVYAPVGTGISHVTVCVCTPESEADCPGCTDPSLSNGGSDNENGNGYSNGNGSKHDSDRHSGDDDQNGVEDRDGNKPDPAVSPGGNQ
ncbi:hypothetical protein EKH57_15740 [Halorubrum sp. BOL3-1]|uniref:hypothetical protein n=1 Tax=Halorubrum sp. BOL3-1 TaxID=2497325 RepID=UPI001004DAEA|nr:hypothetical protein [Halorubrum sp. BOL3-1]QAU14037.1 hypothetical protein EKH57_15740 [Halorubrum sp. BOL3-1]